ncbi:MAG: hypothetical protein Q6363_000660 [Candidatus Njordarchaeota archaeon]
MNCRYEYNVMDWNRNARVPPRLSEDGKIAWYTQWDYDVANLVSADDYTAYYDNGSVKTKPTKNLTVEGEDDPNAPPGAILYEWVVYLYEEPINSPQGNLTKIFYDPHCLQFYQIRDRLVFPILFVVFLPMILTITTTRGKILLRKKLRKRE